MAKWPTRLGRRELFLTINGVKRHASQFEKFATLKIRLVQETFLRLCRDEARLLRRFEARHESAIFGYIKVIATSVAFDHFRARTAEKRAAEVLSSASVGTVDR